MTIALKFADSLNFKRVRKATVFTRSVRLSLAKWLEKLFVKTRPITNSAIRYESKREFYTVYCIMNA